MRLALVALLATMSAIPAFAQEAPEQAIHWTWKLQPENARPGTEAELVLVGELAPHWVVYSSDFARGIGPLPAKLRTKPQSSVELLESLRSIGAARKKDEASSDEYGYFATRAELRQRLRVPADGAPIDLVFSGQACHESDGTCHLIRQDIHIAASGAH